MEQVPATRDVFGVILKPQRIGQRKFDVSRYGSPECEIHLRGKRCYHRQPRFGQWRNEPLRTEGRHASSVVQTAHAVDVRFLEVVGKSPRRSCTPLRVLQSMQDSRIAANDSCHDIRGRRSRMGFVRTHWRGQRLAFIMSLFLLEFGHLRQPLLFVIGYLDTALLLFMLWLALRFARVLVSRNNPSTRKGREPSGVEPEPM